MMIICLIAAGTFLSERIASFKDESKSGMSPGII